MSRHMHSSLASGRWETLSLAEQMGNIGSEISRVIRWKNKGNLKRMTRALDRALELIDLSIRWAQRSDIRQIHPGAIRELCRLREVVCDCYLGENEYESDDVSMLRYFDQFCASKKRQRTGGIKESQHL